MNRLCGLMPIIAAAVLCAGCPPVGSLAGGASASGAVQDIDARPRRYEYILNEAFQQQRDLEVWAIKNNGMVAKVPVDEVEIEIFEDPSDPGSSVSVAGTSYTFQSTGRKDIVVKYNAMSARYDVMVRLLEVGGGTGGGGGGGGIIIVWDTP